MKKLFEKQLSGNLPLTKETLEQLKNKTYFNGENIEVGDVVLYALLKDDDDVKIEDGMTKFHIVVISLNERHLDLFTYEERMQGGNFPMIKYKNN